MIYKLSIEMPRGKEITKQSLQTYGTIVMVWHLYQLYCSDNSVLYECNCIVVFVQKVWLKTKWSLLLTRQKENRCISNVCVRTEYSLINDSWLLKVNKNYNFVNKKYLFILRTCSAYSFRLMLPTKQSTLKVGLLNFFGFLCSSQIPCKDILIKQGALSQTRQFFWLIQYCPLCYRSSFVTRLSTAIRIF